MKSKAKKILVYSLLAFWGSYVGGFSLTCAIKGRFDIRYMLSGETIGFFALFLGLILAIVLAYYYRHYWLLNSKNIMKGKESDQHLASSLEQSRFETDEEIRKNFVTIDYDELKYSDVKGTPIMEKEKEGHLKVTFSSPAHSLVIGTTGSGKTTTFVSPTIEILSETKAKPSLLISDPKGELLANHASSLKEKGYEVKVIDLRNPYNSVRWNPLEKPFLLHQRSLHLENEMTEDEDRGCYLFDGHEYWSKEEKDTAIQVKRQQLSDEVYEDLNDICTVLCPVTSTQEPMWESGAKNFILSIALAMLEDSDDPRLGMSKEKYNFYSLMKVATSTDNDCQDLIDYFKRRSPLSKAVSLSKQVMDSSDKTRGSYLSSAFDKISMFADMSVCALTSVNEIEFSSLADKPVALFLQIPDEKETRHTLASMVILQAYKELVYRANQTKDLTLPRPVYFILDEFGNLPKIHKMEQMVTVGRSRNIWLNLVVQSYSQLSKVYDEKAADIIKSNCNIQIFIGTSDLKTIEDFSKRCGNYSIVERSVGFNSVKGQDINSNQSIKERPLIYPSELQVLNRPGDMGHAIVTVFGYYPIRSTFTPSFLIPQFGSEKSEERLAVGRYFDEAKAYYDMKKRNAILSSSASKEEGSLDEVKSRAMIEQNTILTQKAAKGFLSESELADLKAATDRMDIGKSKKLIEKAIASARSAGKETEAIEISKAMERILALAFGEKNTHAG
jgi:type IV secretory pathway TraG/TraD family ATPase VirD4